jgi:hypothetical protein
MQFLSDCWSRVVFEFAKFRWGQTHLRQYFLWALGGLCPSVVRKGGAEAAAGEAGLFIVGGEVLQELL